MIVSLQNVPKNLENWRKYENLKMRISTKPSYKLLSVAHNYFLWMYIIIEKIYDDRISPKCPENLEKLREKENLEMRISTKPFYKLVSVVHNYFLWMYLIIERIYDDRISPKCAQKLRKLAKMENLKMWISTKPCYKLLSDGSQLLSMNVCNHWEDIWWSYLSKMSLKT